MSAQLFLFARDGVWQRVLRCDPRAREIADNHYSRQTPGARDFLSNGRTLVLLTYCERAVWGVIENMDPAGGHRWRCAIFRNPNGTAGRSSDLIREATERTFTFWTRHYGATPNVPLQTEIDPTQVRRKRDPGRCFRKAGWTDVEVRRGLLIMQAPR